MERRFFVLFWMAIATLCSLSVWAEDKEQISSSEVQQRELIYCAGEMTHEEREAYRSRMRAADNPQEQEAIRRAHQQEMQTTVRGRGIDPVECEPLRQRERLRQRGVSP